MTDAERIAQLKASNRELRGALIFAGRRISKLTRWRMDRQPSLPILREALRQARATAKATQP